MKLYFYLVRVMKSNASVTEFYGVCLANDSEEARVEAYRKLGEAIPNGIVLKYRTFEIDKEELLKLIEDDQYV